MHDNEYLSYEGTQELISYIQKDIAGALCAPAGNPITLTDAAPINAESLVVELEPIQEGSGDPSPTNIRPITGYTECEVDDVGKNLFDGYVTSQTTIIGIGEDLSDVSLTDVYGTNITKNPNNILYVSFCAYLPKGTYTLTNVTQNVYISLNRIAIAGELSISANAHIRENGYAFTTAKDGYTWFSIERDDGYSSYNDIAFSGEELMFQIEKGTSVTSYEPYHSSNATIQFGQTVYGGKSDFVEGGTDDEWNKDDTFSGWYKSSTETSVIIKEITDKKGGTNQIYSNTYKYVSNQGFAVPEGAISDSTNSSYTTYVFVNDSRFAGKTIQECQAILESDGMYFVYQVETPTQLSTPPTDLKLFKGTNNITTNGTTINLGYQPDNALGQVLGEAYKYTDKKTDDIDLSNCMEKGVDYVTAGHRDGYAATVSGTGATEEGYQVLAKGDYAHAEGYETFAEGEYSHTEGNGTRALNDDAHAEGTITWATGESSHAEGYQTTSGYFGSHSEGVLTCAVGRGSHAEGSDTTAYQDYSHTEGYKTYANGDAAHAEGYSTCAYGEYSHAEGFSTTEGITIAYGEGSHAEGAGTSAIGNYSHAQGYKTYAQYSSHAEGTRTTASGSESHAEGTRTYAKGGQSHAEGEGTTASGSQSHVEGNNTYAYGNCSHAEGSNTTAFYNFSHAEGAFTYARGMYSHAEGYQTSAYGNGSHAEGSETSARGSYTHAEGCHTTASNHSSHAGGHYNAAMTTGGSISNQIGTAFVIGNGTANDILSNAFSVEFDGTVHAAGAQVHPAADYAEFFEWIDGNPKNTDRVGYFVTTDKQDPTKIIIANTGDDYILGIVSGAPCIIGNGDCDVWNGMTLKDDFGRTVYVEPGVPKYNPDYNPTQPYIPRRDRKEWAAVGMLGVLPVRDDGTCKPGGYCTVGQRGTATKVDEYDRSINCYKVIERVSDKVVKVIFR